MDWQQIVMMVLDILGILVVGYGTVPAFDLVKHATKLIDNAPTWLKQTVLVPSVALLLGALGQFIQTPLPDTLELFDIGTVETALSAGVALAIKAGKQAITR